MQFHSKQFFCLECLASCTGNCFDHSTVYYMKCYVLTGKCFPCFLKNVDIDLTVVCSSGKERLGKIIDCCLIFNVILEQVK